MSITEEYLSKILESAKGMRQNKSRYSSWRLASIMITGLLVGALMGTVYFIYHNVYNTLSNADAILLLSSNIDENVIDLAAFEKAEKVISTKNFDLASSDELGNIFFYGNKTTLLSPATTTSSSSTTKK